MSSQANTRKLLANVIHQMPTQRYLTYIRSSQWERVRNEHLFLCDYWCEICKKAKACQVHHWTYENLGHENPQDLCAVCIRCHWSIHRNVMPAPANDNQQMAFTFEEKG
jgi:hypothetical protein